MLKQNHKGCKPQSSIYFTTFFHQQRWSNYEQRKTNYRFIGKLLANQPANHLAFPADPPSRPITQNLGSFGRCGSEPKNSSKYTYCQGYQGRGFDSCGYQGCSYEGCGCGTAHRQQAAHRWHWYRQQTAGSGTAHRQQWDHQLAAVSSGVYWVCGEVANRW